MTALRWWRSHSVRMRLTVSYLAVMVAVLGVYAVAVFAFVRNSASAALDQRLRGDFQWAAAMVDQTPEGGITWYQDAEQDAQFEDVRPWLQVWGSDGTILYRSAEAELRVPQSATLAAQPEDGIVSVTVPGATAPIRVLTRRGRIATKPVVIQVAASEDQMWEELGELRLILILGLPLAVGVAGIGGYALARRALRPVELMTERAQSITADRLDDRLPVANPDDEMGRLAVVFNGTLARLQASFDQMRRFTADVSHELRTPLTAIRSVGEVGLRGHRDDAGYRAVIGSMLEEVDRLARLVDRLLTLSRAEMAHAQLSREAIEVDAFVRDVTSHLAVLAEEKGQTLAVESQDAPTAVADRQVLRHALINLVDNAIKFTPPGGQVRVRVSATPADAVIDVTDSGPGIPEDARAHIFDRFYRVDDGAKTGTGLGLSIARGAVDACRGRLTLESSGPAGTTFRITLPRTQVARRRAG